MILSEVIHGPQTGNAPAVEQISMATPLRARGARATPAILYLSWALCRYRVTYALLFSAQRCHGPKVKENSAVWWKEPLAETECVCVFMMSDMWEGIREMRRALMFIFILLKGYLIQWYCIYCSSKFHIQTLLINIMLKIALNLSKMNTDIYNVAKSLYFKYIIMYKNKQTYHLITFNLFSIALAHICMFFLSQNYGHKWSQSINPNTQMKLCVWCFHTCLI